MLLSGSLVQRLPVSDLSVGSKSEFNLFNKQGVLLLKAGSPISPDLIKRLHDSEVESVIVKRPSHGQCMPNYKSSDTPAQVSSADSSSEPIPIQIDATECMFAINEFVTKKASAPNYSERNARSDQRYAFDEVVVLGSLDTDHLFAPILDAWCLDISNQGAGLVTEQAIPLYEKLVIRFDRPIEQIYLFANVKIIRCQPLFGKIHMIGALFTFDERVSLMPDDHSTENEL